MEKFKTHLSAETSLVVGELKYDFNIKEFGTWKSIPGRLPIKSEEIVAPTQDGNRKLRIEIEILESSSVPRQMCFVGTNPYGHNAIPIKSSIINCGSDWSVSDTLQFSGSLKLSQSSIQSTNYDGSKEIRGSVAGTANKASCYHWVVAETKDLDIHLDIQIFANDVAPSAKGSKR